MLVSDKVYIDNQVVGKGEHCFIIAEIGGMYEDIDGMKELIKLSKEAGADAVKVQTYRAEKIARKNAFFENSDGSKVSQYDFFKQYEISKEHHFIMDEYARSQGLIFFSTPSDNDDVELLSSLNVPVYKIGSDDLTNLLLLRRVARKMKPVILSTGMSTVSEIDEAVRTIYSERNEGVILLHCTVSYPADPSCANLAVIPSLYTTFRVPVGYSDHVQGIVPSVVASALGACVIEKHVTLDRRLKRPDYQVSLEPAEFKSMVEAIRKIPVLLGRSDKKVTKIEENWRRSARKSLVSSNELPQGHIIKESDLMALRPATGLSPLLYDKLIGKRLRRNLKRHEEIGISDIE